MPLFEYRCQDCHALTEVLQKLSDPAPDTCPTCGKVSTLTKELSLTSFQLKGGGWYKDLYASAPKDATAATTQSSKGEGATTAPAAPSAASPAGSAPAAAAPAAPASTAPAQGGTGTGGSSSSSGGGSGGSSGSTGGGGSSAASAV